MDGLRHDAVAKVLEPVPWAPLDIDLAELAELASVPGEHGAELPLFMEDTAWPHPGHLDRYLERASTLYVETLSRAAEMGVNILDVVTVLVPAFGAGPEREVVLWQRVSRPELLLPLLA